MASHLKTAQESAIRGGAFSYGCFCTVSCRAGLICCVFFPRVQCCARRGKPSCPNSPSCYTYLSMPCSFLFCIMRRRRSAAPRCLFMCSHPDCLTFSALALRLQFTYAAFHRFACDGCYHARTDGGEYLPLSSPYSPATKPGCSAKAGGQWQKVRCLIEYSVFKLHTRRRAEAVTGSGAGAHPEKMPSPCRR